MFLFYQSLIIFNEKNKQSGFPFEINKYEQKKILKKNT